MATTPSFPGQHWLSFDVRNWYWFVDGDKTRAYSSAAGAYVPADDPDLAAWLEQGGRVTSILNVDELNEVLTLRGVAAVPAEV
jgi:hypothetical protein